MYKKQAPELNFTSGRRYVTSSTTGMMRLNSKHYNKALAFTIKERQLLGIHGLLPPVVRTVEEQVRIYYAQLLNLNQDLAKYLFLLNLSECNEVLFYKLLEAYTEKCLPYVYTPTVGLVCQRYSYIQEFPRGLYITFKDKGHVCNVLQNWPEPDIRAILVTDGGRVLGLGDLGANGMGISVGKITLYTAFGKVRPHQCLPICLDVGCNTDSVREEPYYMGLKRKRPPVDEYDEFIDEFMQAVVKRFGQSCLIQFEDFGNNDAFRFLEKYRYQYCMFNDDIQGTGAVGLAGIISALKCTGTDLKSQRILFQGAGEAAIGLAQLLIIAFKKAGVKEDEALNYIFMRDSKGLVVKERLADTLNDNKLLFAKDMPFIFKLEDCIREIKPTILIGASAQAGSFTKEVLRLMSSFNAVPIIFALSNPTAKSECTAFEAYTHTKGKCLFASGSPFPPLEYDGRTRYASQANNAYIFPGIGLGATACCIRYIPSEIFLIAARTLADICTPEDYAHGRLYPPLSKLSCCAFEIALSVITYAHITNLSTVLPRPTNVRAFLKHQIYDAKYEPVIPPWLNPNGNQNEKVRHNCIDCIDC
uniref:Malic enzyme n=1 Tax=Glossina pallidipes TaxID=7398 RepID=A0A1B0AG60_GLOPL